jgi:hypothetical protein
MTARTGQWDDGLDRRARTGQLGQHNRRGLWGQDSENDKDRTAKSGQDSQIMKAWVTWQLGQSKWDRKTVVGKQRQDRTTRTGGCVRQPRDNIMVRTDETGLSGLVSLDRTGRTGWLEKRTV